jgi:hypothetical protein
MHITIQSTDYNAECKNNSPGFDSRRRHEYQWVWNGVHSALVRINEEYLKEK